MHDVALLLGAAAAGHVLARLCRAPATPFLLMAGLGLGLYAPPGAGVLRDVVVVGVALLLFTAGMELDPGRIGAQRTAALRVGIVQFAALGVLGWGAASALGFTPVEAGYVALALAASSTLVCVRLLRRRQQLFDPYGRLVLGVLFLQDVLVLIGVPFVAAIGAPWTGALGSLAGLLLLGAASLAVRRWIAPLMPRVSDDRELLLLGALALLFLFLGGAWALGLPIVVGAFLAGVSLARFPVEELVRVEVAPIGDFFAAVFFVALGALIGLPSPNELLAALSLALVVLLATPPLVALVAEREGLSARSAVEAGLLLAQTSELSLVIALSGLAAGHVGESTFRVVALVTAATMLVTPLIATDAVAWRFTRLHPARWARRAVAARLGELSGGGAPKDHVVLLGVGSTGGRLLDLLVTGGRSAVVVDEDPAVLAQCACAGVPTVRGDASEPEVLDRAGVDRAVAVVSTVRRPDANAVLLDRVAGRVPVLVRVFEEDEAAWVRLRGGVPILSSEVTARSLMEWYAEAVPGLERRLVERVVGPSRPRRPPSRRS